MTLDYLKVVNRVCQNWRPNERFRLAILDWARDTRAASAGGHVDDEADLVIPTKERPRSAILVGVEIAMGGV